MGDAPLGAMQPGRTALLGGVTFTWGALAAPAVAWACQSDSDCKGDRVCVDGACTAPLPMACQADVDCPNDQICEEGRCAGTAAPTPAPEPPPPPLPEPALEDAPAESGEEAPPLAAGTGGLELTSPRAGIVRIDGVERGHYDGKRPLFVPNVVPGQRKVKVYFDSGGSGKGEVMVEPGRYATLEVPLCRACLKFPYRRGVSVGVQGGLNYLYQQVLEADDGFHGGGLDVGFVTNFGLAPAIDLRTGVNLKVSAIDFAGTTAIDGAFGVPIHLQLNLGNVYSMRFGPRLGLNFVAGDGFDTLAHFFVGPSFAPAVFRIGPKGAMELAIQGDFDFLIDDFVIMNAYVGPRLTFLFLPDWSSETP